MYYSLLEYRIAIELIDEKKEMRIYYPAYVVLVEYPWEPFPFACEEAAPYVAWP